MRETTTPPAGTRPRTVSRALPGIRTISIDAFFASAAAVRTSLSTSNPAPGGASAIAAASPSFAPGVTRTATTFSAGYIHSFPYRRFLPADVAAGLIWATYAACLGYFGGKSFEEQPWKGLILAFVVASAVAGLVELVRHRREKRRERPVNASAPD